MLTLTNKLAIAVVAGLMFFGQAVSARAAIVVNISSITMPSNLTNTPADTLYNSGLNLTASGVISSYNNSNASNPVTFAVGNVALSQPSPSTSFGPQVITALAVTETLTINGISVGTETFNLPALVYNSPVFYEAAFSTFPPQTFAIGHTGESVIVQFSGPTLFNLGGPLSGGVTETLSFVASPEPSSMVLMGVGAVAMGVVAHRRRRAS